MQPLKFNPDPLGFTPDAAAECDCNACRLSRKLAELQAKGAFVHFIQLDEPPTRDPFDLPPWLIRFVEFSGRCFGLVVALFVKLCLRPRRRPRLRVVREG